MARRRRRYGFLALLAAVPACAADYPDRDAAPSPLPRFFPREDGEGSPMQGIAPRPLRVACRPRRAPVPTNAPDDPSYVGSTYGLSKPSYYGLTPPPGVDDPFGRPLLGYCP